MPFAPIKFRCPRCSQLLGAPPSKAGRAIRCPKCRSELIVPAGQSAGAGGNNLEFGPFLDTPTSGEFRTLAGSDADFLNLGPAPSAAPPVREGDPVDSPEEPPSPPAGHWTSESVIVFDSPPLISPRSGNRGPSDDDVPIPRFFLMGGCLMALLAVAGAFASGLLVGKYVWPGPC